MQLQFRGWRRETTVHQHTVIPVVSHGSNLVPVADGSQAMTWNADYSTYGKVDKLALSGSFLVQLKFEEKDLEAWLSKYVHTEPERAIKLLAKMQAQAVINLTKELANAA
jgi:hypothetical protein